MLKLASFNPKTAIPLTFLAVEALRHSHLRLVVEVVDRPVSRTLLEHHLAVAVERPARRSQSQELLEEEEELVRMHRHSEALELLVRLEQHRQRRGLRTAGNMLHIEHKHHSHHMPHKDLLLLLVRSTLPIEHCSPHQRVQLAAD